MSDAGDLTTLDDVKNYMSETSSNADAALALLITAESGFVKRYCDDPFLQNSYDFIESGWGGRMMPLPYGPVSSVTSVMVNNQNIPARSLPSRDGFSFNSKDQCVRLSGYTFCHGQNNVEIFYTAGYATIDDLPGDLRFAVTKLVVHRFRERTRTGKGNESIGGKQTASYNDSMPSDVQVTLDRYRRRSIG